MVESGATPDLNNGELISEENQMMDSDDEEESVFDMCFRDALMNCMTPLHVAAALGNDDLAPYLIEHGANVNL